MKVLGAYVDCGMLGDRFQGGGDEWDADESSEATQVQIDVTFSAAVGLSVDLQVGGFVQELENRKRDADQDSGEKVRCDDGDEGCGVDEQRDSAVAGEVAHVFGLDEIEAGEDEHPGEAAGGHHPEQAGE